VRCHAGSLATVSTGPSHQARILAAVEQQILAGDVTGVRAAQEGAGRAELIGSPKRLAGMRPWAAARNVSYSAPRAAADFRKMDLRRSVSNWLAAGC